ncbi:3-ketodihydrosphingosine reductase TSC10 [Choanephora cucurbitarum]|uniref:3-dehydrosphinganine reductase n=1 Tax=Choanephora cucurbitarum TaxID=101091 RepID=A0A1C7N9G8_9FUNG|nr:3-ketodihydrosphingosine reductase TSC10 [Choanephora cucurbitarum]
MSLPSWASVLISLGAVTVAVAIVDFLYSKWNRVPFRPAGKHCFITGGSTGLGKALAIELVKAGADVTIVARRVTELEAAFEEIKANCTNENQKVVYVSADVTVQEDVVRAFNEATIKMGRDPEFVCACAGASYPRYFLDETMENFENLIKLNYLGQAYVAHQAAQRMRDQKIKDGKIVFVSSMLGLFSFVGYANYSPTKFAVRALADALRNELKRYQIGVHIFYPGNIQSPGFDTENLTKPEVTKEIEGVNVAQPANECAQSLLKGLYSGEYMITVDWLAYLLRCSARGVNPTNNLVLDFLTALVAQPAGSAFALYMDWVVAHGKYD